MPFSDLFNSENIQRARGHFSAIVRVAHAGGNITEEEQRFLDKLATSLQISDEEYKEILKDPSKYQINAPYLYIERLEALYKLARIVHRDHQLGDLQEHLLIKFALALGFTPGNVNYIVNKALKLVDMGVDEETFLYEMKNMYK
ncbi:TerB family tellurite resistance protein [Flavobacterium gilvum]|uniref:Fructose 1,6-bisphosphatase n=1 Tax=Flavobacterium gilvum TaxID=1492737 RepID=A0AAC9N584_9FLAO|nr:TerB family tellurite resistance protein [Flavobacterium gilvum]AOW09072.1 fructose 1,6-bisphosphatase [Flavobacterium gilvum]KFC60628.1 fructose-1,6-bisphosphatase [Flavobacterium gilvum]